MDRATERMDRPSYMDAAHTCEAGLEEEDEGEHNGAVAEGFDILAKGVDLAWAAVYLIENYRYPPSALAGENQSHWELDEEDGANTREAVLDEQGCIRERLEFREVLNGGGQQVCLPGTALLLINTSSRKKFSVEMRKQLVLEAQAYSLTMVLRIAGSVVGQVTNLNVSREEPRIEVHSGRTFFPQFGPLADFTDFRLIPTGRVRAEADRCELQRITQDISSILQQQGEHVLKCVEHFSSYPGGAYDRSLISPGGVCEARFRDDGRALERQAASALGVLPGRVRCIEGDDNCFYIVVEGEPLEDIGQLRVARPISAEVLHTGALEGDVVETVTEGKLAFLVVAPDDSLEPRRRRILESLRKPSEMHALQTSVFLDVQAATERRYRELLREEDEIRSPLTLAGDAARQAPRRAITRIHAVVGSEAYREARGNLHLAQAQVTSLGKADARLGHALEKLTSAKPPVIWKEDVVLDAIAQAVWHVRWSGALARAIHGLPPALEDIDEDSENDELPGELPDELSASQKGSGDEEGLSASQASDISDLSSDAEEAVAELPEAALALCARTDGTLARTLAEAAAPENELPEEQNTFLRRLAGAMESRSVHLCAADVAWMRHEPRRTQWLRLSETADKDAAGGNSLPRRVRQAFWKACASNEMLDDVARACQSIDADPRVSLEQELHLLDMWVAGNASGEVDE